MSDIIKAITPLLREAQEEYVNQGGTACPVCKGLQITTTRNMDIDGNRGFQDIVCEECGSNWTDIYNLVDCEIKVVGVIQ